MISSASVLATLAVGFPVGLDVLLFEPSRDRVRMRGLPSSQQNSTP